MSALVPFLAVLRNYYPSSSRNNDIQEDQATTPSLEIDILEWFLIPVWRAVSFLGRMARAEVEYILHGILHGQRVAQQSS
mmetsp:Transcript_11438/g.26549  ORF Transcript_11438/g.26549 Transcript_11438/m.26549 type:complete len:80 (-) Transcript_11438:969-1208(-)